MIPIYRVFAAIENQGKFASYLPDGISSAAGSERLSPGFRVKRQSDTHGCPWERPSHHLSGSIKKKLKKMKIKISRVRFPCGCVRGFALSIGLILE